MSNEELAVLIQAGRVELLPDLWENVQRFIAKQAHRRMALADGFGGVTFEDLYQSGYLALVGAVDSYDPERGYSFISCLSLRLKTAFAEAGWYRSSKQSCDPLLRAGSLDAPLLDDEDSGTLAETIPDPDAEEVLRYSELRLAVADILAELPAEQRKAVVSRYWYERPCNQRDHDAALRFLRHPDRSRRLKALR